MLTKIFGRIKEVLCYPFAKHTPSVKGIDWAKVGQDFTGPMMVKIPAGATVNPSPVTISAVPKYLANEPIDKVRVNNLMTYGNYLRELMNNRNVSDVFTIDQRKEISNSLVRVIKELNKLLDLSDDVEYDKYENLFVNNIQKNNKYESE